ncbi:MAG: 50S ribosomal protein L19 [Patescibacteria group bacterium]
MNPTYQFDQSQTRGKTSADFMTLKPGATVKVHQTIKEGEKSRIQIFEGIIIARKHGSGPSATITVRKISNGIGVERIFPLHLPTIAKFEVTKNSKVRRSKLYYLRTKTARETRKKTKVIETKATTIEVATP